MNDSAECDNKSVLDLSKQQLRKIPKQPAEIAQHVRVLILDENELQKIDNVDAYMRIEHLSVCKNQLLRMYGVCRLHQLQQLHLAYNGILTVEGMKELTQLRHLNLEGNNIKAIEHLTTNCKLEYLNLSENSIASISDLSYLKCLKELNVQGNRITHLRQCDKFLPGSLESLQLAKNGITDLNEICTLSHLSCLQAISVADNPCVQMTGSVVGFDYRPFVLNWCMTVKSIDGFIVNPIESLKAEWLYSQGRGRQFRIGEQQPLARYLSSVCPLSGEVLENENERKLRLILSKAQQHQRQLLQEESNTISAAMSMSTSSLMTHGGGGSGSCASTNSNSPSSARRRQAAAGQHNHSGSRIQSPRFSRLGRQGSPDSMSMSSSVHGNSSLHDLGGGGACTPLQMSSSMISNVNKHADPPHRPSLDDTNIMVQSLDPHILSTTTAAAQNAHTSGRPLSSGTMSDLRSSPQLMAMMLSSNFADNMSLSSRSGSSPLSAASKMVPVPESLMSPDCPPLNVVQRSASTSQCNANASGSHHASARKSTGKLHDSPKSTARASTAQKHRQPSPVLHQTRKVHQNLMNSIQMQQQQAQFQREQQLLQHQHQLAPLPSSSVHVTPPDAQSTATNSDNEDQHDNDESGVRSSARGTTDADEDDDDDDSENINLDNLKTIRNKAAQRSLLNRPTSAHVAQYSNRKATKSALSDNKIVRMVEQPAQRIAAIKLTDDEQINISAILIQKLWRGHQARLKFKEAAKVMQTQRTQNYIEKLTADMETTKIALENERKIQQLQMQAINALWKKVSNMPTSGVATISASGHISTSVAAGANELTTTATANSTAAVANGGNGCQLLGSSQSQAIVQDLAKTCSVLTSQVQQLQGSMHDILQCMTVFCQLPQQQQQQQQQLVQPPPAHPTVTSMVADTQTEIIAVHTPQVDNPPFPFRSARQKAAAVADAAAAEMVDTPPPAIKQQRPSTLPLDVAQTSLVAVASVATEVFSDDDNDDVVDDRICGAQMEMAAKSADQSVATITQTSSSTSNVDDKIC